MVPSAQVVQNIDKVANVKPSNVGKYVFFPNSSCASVQTLLDTATKTPMATKAMVKVFSTRFANGSFLANKPRILSPNVRFAELKSSSYFPWNAASLQ